MKDAHILSAQSSENLCPNTRDPSLHKGSFHHRYSEECAVNHQLEI